MQRWPPRVTGDQADVMLWRLIGVFHLLLASITQSLQARTCCYFEL